MPAVRYMVYGRFDSKIRFENESDGRFDSNEKNDSQVPRTNVIIIIIILIILIYVKLILQYIHNRSKLTYKTNLHCVSNSNTLNTHILYINSIITSEDFRPFRHSINNSKYQQKFGTVMDDLLHT